MTRNENSKLYNSEENENEKINISFSPKTMKDIQYIFHNEKENMNIIDNDITKPKNIPEQIKDYYKIISIDNTFFATLFPPLFCC